MISLLIALIVIGAILYVMSLLPIDQRIKQIAYVVVIVFLAIYVIRHLGAWGVRL